MEKTTLKAVGYRRVSMREQVDGHSLDAQEKNIRDYAASTRLGVDRNLHRCRHLCQERQPPAQTWNG